MSLKWVTNGVNMKYAYLFLLIKKLIDKSHSFPMQISFKKNISTKNWNIFAPIEDRMISIPVGRSNILLNYYTCIEVDICLMLSPKKHYHQLLSKIAKFSVSVQTKKKVYPFSICTRSGYKPLRIVYNKGLIQLENSIVTTVPTKVVAKDKNEPSYNLLKNKGLILSILRWKDPAGAYSWIDWMYNKHLKTNLINYDTKKESQAKSMTQILPLRETTSIQHFLD